MCTDASPSKNTRLGLLCALWHFGLILSREANQSWEELLMVAELGGWKGKDSSQDP